MDQILLTVITVYGAPYVVNYIANTATTMALTKTKKVVTKKVSDVLYKKNDEIDIEYEYITVDSSGNIVNEPILYVTSKKEKLIEQSWNDITQLSTISIAQSTTGLNRPLSAHSAHSSQSSLHVI
jgi:hypothetical protein